MKRKDNSTLGNTNTMWKGHKMNNNKWKRNENTKYNVKK